MNVELRHLRYTFVRTVWVPIVFGLLIAIIAVGNHGTSEDVLWGLAPGALLWAALFSYWLWRTQKKR